MSLQWKASFPINGESFGVLKEMLVVDSNV
jgi:hypothetical protein